MCIRDRLSPARELNRTETTDVALAFLNEVHRRTGREPAIYCSASTARDDYDSRLASYSLWVADYGAREPESNDIWETWAGWQYSDRGRVDGVDGNVDLDLFTAEMRSEPAPTPVSYTHLDVYKRQELFFARFEVVGLFIQLFFALGQPALHAPHFIAAVADFLVQLAL